jgi:PilZ domain
LRFLGALNDRVRPGVRESEEHAAVGALAWKIAEPAQVERRHDQRVKVRLLGRFMRSDRKEFDCESIDASPYGIAFSSDAGVQPNERIVAYLNQIGRVEGRVARIFPGGFAIQMNVPPAKRDKLNSQLTWLANRQSLGLADDRRHERIAPRDRYTILTLPNGREYTATLIDISMSGAALNVDCEPPIGARVVVGATPAEVVRHVNCGIAVEFLSPLPAEEFGENATI